MLWTVYHALCLAALYYIIVCNVVSCTLHHNRTEKKIPTFAFLWEIGCDKLNLIKFWTHTLSQFSWNYCTISTIFAELRSHLLLHVSPLFDPAMSHTLTHFFFGFECSSSLFEHVKQKSPISILIFSALCAYLYIG